ncbi:hypothetical protein BDV24DRAFT_161873 [Aspergillus arachidicola]|uniref:Uncharacterized protein n=1 Tax=Aspergillus arachidicola TaxID=656916 RepID=A0A5N6YEX2_9EURO|nr:hypothetical protein BDV24DRAFT_161873 [Aspergillus arachidicola]
MKAALVTSWGKPPQYISIPDLPPPTPTQVQLKVLATSVTRVVRSRAAGAHSTAFKAPLPYDPSVDGVAIDEITGDMYFITQLLWVPLASSACRAMKKLSPPWRGSIIVSCFGSLLPFPRVWDRCISYWTTLVVGLQLRAFFRLLRVCMGKTCSTSRPLCILGTGVGCFTVEDWRRELPEIMKMISHMHIPFPIFTVPLSGVASAWESEDTLTKRLVLMPGA